MSSQLSVFPYIQVPFHQPSYCLPSFGRGNGSEENSIANLILPETIVPFPEVIIRGKSRQLLPYISSVQADYVQGPFLHWDPAFLIYLSTFHCPTTKPVSVCLCHNAACNFADLFPCRLRFIFPHQCNDIWWSVWQARELDNSSIPNTMCTCQPYLSTARVPGLHLFSGAL